MAEYEDSTAADVLAAYERGERRFPGIQIIDADFGGRRLRGVSFVRASLQAGNFDDAILSEAAFIGCDLTGASLVGANLAEARFDATELTRGRLQRANLIGTVFEDVDLAHADFTSSMMAWAHFTNASLRDATVDRSTLGSTAFSHVDVSPFCDAHGLVHGGPSYIDFRSVLRSYHHPGLKRFLVDCGVPPLVAEYTIAAAEAEGDALASLMRSTFISYGGPDEPFARRLYEELRAHGVTTFFFPETARLGKRIGDEVHSRIQEHDRVILVCSRDSLDRPGVRNEIQETFDREARDGGATYLLPIMLDDYVLTGWADSLAERVRGRVVGDFRGALSGSAAFDRAMSRLLAALRKEPS